MQERHGHSDFEHHYSDPGRLPISRFQAHGYFPPQTRVQQIQQNGSSGVSRMEVLHHLNGSRTLAWKGRLAITRELVGKIVESHTG
jgi:hypothetical protein